MTTETRDEFIARAVQNSGYTPEAAAYQWDSQYTGHVPEYDVDGVYTAKELATDIVRILGQHDQPENIRLVLAVARHLSACGLLDE